MSVRVIHGDCRAVMGSMDEASVDAIVCDPPYLLEFMGKEFDRQHKQMEGANAGEKMQAWHLSWAREAYRVLRPGGHLLAFGGTRTGHRLAAAIEDAGFEIRDQIMWLHSQGFAKVGYIRGADGDHVMAGWAGSLKPAHEPIVLVRKPLSEKTVAANVLAHGTGALNIDGCRVAGAVHAASGAVEGYGGSLSGLYEKGSGRGELRDGRWPANVIHSGDAEIEAAFAAFGSDKGAAAPVRRRNGDKFRNAYGAFKGDVDEAGSTFQGDTGTASRFFYCAKAGRSERWKHVVCRCSAQVIPPGHVLYKLKHCPVCGDEFGVTAHPTQKPESLMRYLCRLITPPGGTVLDMFAGSGSTGCAALAEGFGFIGIEADEIYAAIAEARIAAARVGPKDRPKARAKTKAEVQPSPTPDLFSLAAE